MRAVRRRATLGQAANLRGEYICKCWTSQPQRFNLNPLQQRPGLNTWNDTEGHPDILRFNQQI